MTEMKRELGNILPKDFFDNAQTFERLKIESTYANAIQIQSAEVEQLQKETKLRFPPDFNFQKYVLRRFLKS